MQPAYYSVDIPDFIKRTPQEILGHLAEHHPHELDQLQRNSWLAQIELLQRELKATTNGWVAFEFNIPRMGKRVDNIIIFQNLIFVLEFKIGAKQYDAAAIDQAMDYALDLKNFHSGSHTRSLVPVVIATQAEPKPIKVNWYPDGVCQPVLSDGNDLPALFSEVVRQTPAQTHINGVEWAATGYKPTPTIIEAAQALYQGHRVDEITRSDAGAKNLSETANCLSAIIEKAKSNQHKAICFVTGVPGAGKTLAGLNLATLRAEHSDEHAVFLSGNGPLVDVLRESLARDNRAQSREGGQELRKEDALRKVKSFIQNIHHFRDSNLQSADAPVEKVAVFDEAQRAWDSAHLAGFMVRKRGVPDFAMSEPEYLISVMDRHKDWCTVVCLVGGGQEINAGEAGLGEWFSALKNHFPHWKIYTSPQLAHKDYHWGNDLTAMLNGLDHEFFEALHLSVSIRSFRAEKLSEFVGALIDGNATEARAIYQEIKGAYPIALTRDLERARNWLRARARGSERFGLVASSGAYRLKPYGLNVHDKIAATNWFLNEKMDVRSSYYLEDPATEFDIQGLELDWVGICWEADFRYVNQAWSHHKFRGTAWQNVKNAFQQTYLANAYRVLLTRARQGMVIFIPSGDPSDLTRPPEYYDGTAKFLRACGLELLESGA